MSLNGGIFVPTRKEKPSVKISSGSGKSFTIGESHSCDWVIENGGPIYCELCIDNFGRVSKTLDTMY